MAEQSSEGPKRPSSLPLPTPSSPYTPSPLTPTGTRPRLGPRRQSRFTEDMTERTPATSISERSMDYYWYGPSAEDINTNTNNTHNFPAPSTGQEPAETPGRNRRTWVRFVNGALHIIPCLVTLGILGYAMRVLGEDVGSYMSIQGIVLLCVLFADVVLDTFTLFQAQKPWPTWRLVLRFICGIAYIVFFLVYVGLGGPFPAEYTYWGLPIESAAPVLYTLLSLVGLWNLLHIPVCRYRLGSSSIRPRTAASTCSPTPTLNNHTSYNHRFSVAGTEHSSLSLTWRRWVRTRSTRHSRDDLENGFVQNSTLTRDPSADFTLREQPGEEEEDGEGDSSRASSSHGGDGEKGGEGAGIGGEKWREGRPDETGCRVRPKDVGQ